MLAHINDEFLGKLMEKYGAPLRISTKKKLVLALAEFEGPDAITYERRSKGNELLVPNNPAAFGISGIRDIYIFMDTSSEKPHHIVVMEGIRTDSQTIAYYLIGGKEAAGHRPCVFFCSFKVDTDAVLSVFTVEKGREGAVYSKSYRYTERTWAALHDQLEIITCLMRMKTGMPKDSIDRLGQFLLIGGTDCDE